MRLIKRYRNRRLYDTELKRAITYTDIKSYVLRNLDFRIVDNTSGKDITVPVLSSIMGEAAEEPKDAGLRIIDAIIKKGGYVATDLFKKLALASIGAVNLTRERAEEIFDELVKRGEMTKDEKAEALKNFVDKSLEASEKIKDRSEEMFKKFSEKFGSKISEQVSEISERLEQLALKVDALEKKLNKR